jgi:hypothetical protein
MSLTNMERGTLTFGFGFPLRSRGLALRTDLCEAGQVGLSFVGLALGMQLVKWASAVRGARAGARAEANTKYQNEIETEKVNQRGNERIYLPITFLGLLLLLLLPAHKI